MTRVKPIMLQRLDRIQDLPGLPEVVQKLERASSEPDSSAKDVAEIIEADAALSARFLKLANSTFYDLGDNEVGSVQQVVTKLGFSEVRKTCLALGVVNLFTKKSALINHKSFWLHCLTVGYTTRSVADLSQEVIIDPDEAFVAGLLHDIGALVLDHYFNRLYSLVHQEAHRTKRAIHLVERESFQLSHADVGAYVLEKWGIPDRLVEAARHHHDPSRAPEEYRTLCQLVHLADFACTKHGVAAPGEEPLATASIRAWNELGLEAVNFLELLDRVSSEVKRCDVFLSSTS